MEIYFDTNVYCFVERHRQSRAVRDMLDQAGHRVRVSASNLCEMFAIRDLSARRARLEAYITIASQFEEKPQPWHHAQEVLQEISRCRRRSENTDLVEKLRSGSRLDQFGLAVSQSGIRQ